MCGIAGIFQRDGAPAALPPLKAMTDVLAHRGPDGEGQHVDGSIGLGHRRLAIIDLSLNAHQPMRTSDGRYVITYNGELYNFQELRAVLEKHGCHFSSRSDTEVILYAFATWGLRALERFNGIFAFAIWDREMRQLTLARDRYGVKPLYYCERGSIFLFGSEIKALLAHPALTARPDFAAWLEYFTFQNFFTDRMPVQGVHLLLPGTYLRVNSDNAPLSVQRYWDYSFQEPEAPKSDAEYLDELDFLFQQAVKRQLVSDVDVSSYLSGGMDSGTITAVASRHLPHLRTFTCGFDLSSASGIELNFDERGAAERMSYLFNTEHYETVLKAGDMQRVLPRLAYHLEEPRVGQSYPNFCISHLASKFNKVVLAGTGGDELFGGYPWRYYRAVVNDDFEHYIDKYYAFWQRLIPNQTIHKVFAPVWDEVKHVWTRDIFRDVYANHANELKRPEDYVNHSLYLEAKTFLHGLLVVEDKLSMAHGLETRVPFLDNDLVDFAMRVPARLKLRNLSEVIRLNENIAGDKKSIFFKKTNDGKVLLRQMMKRYLPQEVVEREKQGFSAPDASWFKGESIAYVQKTLFNNRARIYEFLDHTVVQELVTDHLEGRENRRLLIWSLLNVEQTMQTFF
jgi:asparagine synthase (glutamine-hydrolysing)